MNKKQDKAIPANNRYYPLALLSKQRKLKKKALQAMEEKATSFMLMPNSPNVSWKIGWSLGQQEGRFIVNSVLSITGINGANYHTLVPSSYHIDCNQCFDRQESLYSQVCIENVPQQLPLLNSSQPLIQASKEVETPEVYLYRTLRSLVEEVAAQFDWYLANIAEPLRKGEEPKIKVEHQFNGTVFRVSSYCLGQVESLQAATLGPACSMLGAEEVDSSGHSLISPDTRRVAEKLLPLREIYACSQQGTPFSLMYNHSLRAVQPIQPFIPDQLVPLPFLEQHTDVLTRSFAALVAQADSAIPAIPSKKYNQRSNAIFEFAVNPMPFLKPCSPSKLVLDTTKNQILRQEAINQYLLFLGLFGIAGLCLLLPCLLSCLYCYCVFNIDRIRENYSGLLSCGLFNALPCCKDEKETEDALPSQVENTL